jgi:Mn-dependent DtxR family transcriptional regulator
MTETDTALLFGEEVDLSPEIKPYTKVNHNFKNFNLNANAKILLSALVSLSNNDEGFSWARQKYFAGLINVSTKTIQGMFSRLIDKGLITAERTFFLNKTRTVYRITDLVKYQNNGAMYTMVDQRLASLGLKGDSQLILSEIISLSSINENGIAWPSKRQLADLINKSVMTVSRKLKNLEENDFIHMERRVVDGQLITLYSVTQKTIALLSDVEVGLSDQNQASSHAEGSNATLEPSPPPEKTSSEAKDTFNTSVSMNGDGLANPATAIDEVSEIKNHSKESKPQKLVKETSKVVITGETEIEETENEVNLEERDEFWEKIMAKAKNPIWKEVLDHIYNDFKENGEPGAEREFIGRLGLINTKFSSNSNTECLIMVSDIFSRKHLNHIEADIKKYLGEKGLSEVTIKVPKEDDPLAKEWEIERQKESEKEEEERGKKCIQEELKRQKEEQNKRQALILKQLEEKRRLDSLSWEEAFDYLFKIYPVQQDKERARLEFKKAFFGKKLPNFSLIVNIICYFKEHDRFWKNNYVPNLTNWLRGKRWQDVAFEKV